MNFDFTEEQTMIKDSVSRFVRDEYDFDTRRKIVESDEGISREFWSMFAELGWLSVPFAEEYGGVGGTVDPRPLLWCLVACWRPQITLLSRLR